MALPTTCISMGSPITPSSIRSSSAFTTSTSSSFSTTARRQLMLRAAPAVVTVWAAIFFIAGVSPATMDAVACTRSRYTVSITLDGQKTAYPGPGILRSLITSFRARPVLTRSCLSSSRRSMTTAATTSKMTSSTGRSIPCGPTMAPDGISFFGPFISGAHRLADGHTFINSGPQGRFFEVTPKGEIVWEYWSPYSGEASLPHHEFLVEDNNPFLYASFPGTQDSARSSRARGPRSESAKSAAAGHSTRRAGGIGCGALGALSA